MMLSGLLWPRDRWGMLPQVDRQSSNLYPIAKISFTGSTATGRAIMAVGAQGIKRVTLELGGKSPTIILDDADLDIAIPQALMTGLANSGQACIDGTRILAPESRLDEMLNRLRAAVGRLEVGPGSDPANDIGPMVSQKQWERVRSYIRLGQQEGAILLAGGEDISLAH